MKDFDFMGNPRRIFELDELEVGKIYRGQCRNAHHAYWNGIRFVHQRTKFGDTFLERIEHPDNDQVYDVFTPEAEADETDQDVIELREAINTMTDSDKEWTERVYT